MKNSYQKLSLPAASGKMVLRYGMTNHLKERLFVPKMWWMHTVNSPQHLWLLHLVFHVTAWDLLARSRGLSLPSLHIPAEPSAWERAGSTRTHTGLLMTTDSPLERAGNFWTKKKTTSFISISKKTRDCFELTFTLLAHFLWAESVSTAEALFSICHKALFSWQCLQMSSFRGQRAHYSSCWGISVHSLNARIGNSRMGVLY